MSARHRWRPIAGLADEETSRCRCGAVRRVRWGGTIYSQGGGWWGFDAPACTGEPAALPSPAEAAPAAAERGR